jgi:hypothetical protein
MDSKIASHKRLNLHQKKVIQKQDVYDMKSFWHLRCNLWMHLLSFNHYGTIEKIAYHINVTNHIALYANSALVCLL